MPSLFSLFVDLKANTADFVSGMSTASYAAKKAARDIEDSFSSLGSIATAALAPFGELGAAIGETLSRVGEYAGKASEQFAHLGGGMNAIAVAGGAATGAMAAVGAGAIAIALHTAESAAKLHELSQSTGVSVEALSGFGFVAKETGVDTQTMTTGLERLSKSAFAAAAGPAGAVTAYSRLGISIRDSGGQLRSVESIFTDVAAKFASMPDGVAKSALAMQIFGRSGAELIPVLNSGRDGIERYLATAQKLGIVLDSGTAESAHQFEQHLQTMEGAAQGVAIQLTKDMLGPMQAISGAMVQMAENANKGTGAVAAIADGFKYFLQIADFVYTELELITSWLTKTAVAWEVFGEGAASAAGKVAHLDFSGAAAVWKDTFTQLDAIQADYIARGKENWKAYQDFVGEVFGKPKAGASEPAKPPIPIASKQTSVSGVADKDVIADLVTKLAAEASAQLELASSIQQSVAAMTLAKAVGEADVKIAEERTQLLDREKTLREQLAGAQTGAHPEEAAKYTAEIAAVQGYLQELDRDAPLIRERYQEIAVAKLFVTTGEDFSKEETKFDAQIASLNQLVAAYKEGGSAIAAADVSKQVETARQKVADLAEAYARFAAENPFDLPALAELGSGLLNADSQLQNLVADAAILKNTEIVTEVQRQTRAFQDQVPALTQLASAYLQGTDAVREAQVNLKLADFQATNHPPSPKDFADTASYQQALGAYGEAIKNVTALYRQQSDAARAATIAQLAGEYDLGVQLKNRLLDLNQAKALIQSQGDSTLAVDAAIYDANQKNIEQWDQAALKVGSVTDKFREFANQIELEGQNFGEKVFSSMSKAVDDASTQLAKFVVTGKSNFKQLFESLEESVAKAGFQRVFAGITKAVAGGPGDGSGGAAGPGGAAGVVPGPVTDFFKKIGVNTGIPKLPLPGGAVRADGTQGNPFYTIPVDAQGNALTSLTGKNVGSASIIGSLFNQPQKSGISVNDDPFPDLLKQLGAPNIPGPSIDSSGGGPVTDFLSSIGADTGIPNLAPPTGASSSGLDAELGGLTKTFTSIFSSLGGTLGSLGKSFGSIFGGIGGLFGGFLAGGGDVTPGKAYVVGERHPEFFIPRQSGHVAPSLTMSGGNSINMGGFHVHGVKDTDSFGRSQSQIYARLHREMEVSARRNG